MNKRNVGTLALMAAAVSIALGALTACNIGVTDPRFAPDPDSSKGSDRLDDGGDTSGTPNASIGRLPLGYLG